MKPVKTLYFAHTDTSMHDLIRHAMPEQVDLITLQTDTDEERIEKIADADMVILSGHRMTEAHLDAAKKLKLVIFIGVGYHDYVSIESLTRRGITLGITPVGTGLGVAEHTIMLMSAVGKRLPHLDRSMREGVWLAKNMRAESSQIYGKTIGLVGLGRIGSEVARRLQGWGVEVLYTEIRDIDPALEAELKVTRTGLEDLLRRSDIVSLHVPLTPDTRYMLDTDTLAMMKPGSILINCARGPVVRETALVAALESGHLSGAGLDVFEIEPPPHPTPFAKFRNVVLTPHNAPGTADIMRLKMQDLWAEAARHFDGQQIENRITLGTA